MDNYVVYIHQNKLNGKRYIGITNNTSKRWYGNGKKYENCPRFHSAIKKYGWDNFYHVVIVSGLTLDEANVLEQFYIHKYRTCEKDFGYNLQRGGHFVPTMLGKHHSEETKEKMRRSALGRVISEEQKKHHSEVMKGKLVGEKNHMSVAVRCINTGEVFESQQIAAKAKGVLQSKISLCCQGKRNHVHGLMWEYVNKGDNVWLAEM